MLFSPVWFSISIKRIHSQHGKDTYGPLAIPHTAGDGGRVSHVEMGWKASYVGESGRYRSVTTTIQDLLEYCNSSKNLES